MTRVGAIALIVVVVLAGGSFLMRKLFPVDPRVATATARMTAGQQKIDNQHDYQGALADFQAASAALPNDPEAWLWIGAVQEKLGNRPRPAAPTAAPDLRPRATTSIFTWGVHPSTPKSPSIDPARADLTPRSRSIRRMRRPTICWPPLKRTRGTLQAAAQALDKASQYAEARQQSELVAMARFRLGMLMQRMQVLPPQGTPTP